MLRREDWGGPFAAADLERSIPFEIRRRLRGDTGEALLDGLLSQFEAANERRRRRRPEDAQRLRTTASALLANLVVAARNRVDGRRFVSVPFRRSDFADTELSALSMALLRDLWLSLGLVEGSPGYQRMSATGSQTVAHARRTRLRAARTLLDHFEQFGVDRRNVGWSGTRDLIIVRLPSPDLAPEPPDVWSSREVLSAVTDRILASDVSLPEEAWARVIARYQEERDTNLEGAEDRVHSGDLSAVLLYRVFKYGWDSGGRIYGGWWINLPKSERKHLTICGEPVVELDYARLHPTLLFARTGQALDFDPYLAPDLDGPGLRELGKRTFNRLINKTSAASGLRPRLPAQAEDLALLPEGLSFSTYLNRFVARLAPVADYFGAAEGLRLQREDSDLAVEILRRLEAKAIPALPVHDSFIVQARHASALRAAMTGAFADRYGFEPTLR